jgi:DNA polymerase III epsilon subunit family exonuclease
MGTDDFPLPEIQLVPDAALPEPEVMGDDIVIGAVLPRPPETAPSPAAIDAERQRAIRVAGLHLDRMRRRAARQPAARLDSWADIGLWEARYCVIDLETTGTGVWGADEILEVGAVRLTGAEMGVDFATLVQPAGPISRASQRIHGITPVMVDDAPPIESVLPPLLEMLRDCVLVFHNAPFDLGFLQRALAAAEREPLANPVVDTLVVARQLLGAGCGLGTLGARLGLPAPHLHRALADARLTAQLLLVLLDCLHEAGARSLGEIPGIRARAPRQRRAPAGPAGLVAQELRAAAASGRPLLLAYRLGAGLAPQELHVVPVAVRGSTCLVRLCDDETPLLLAVERIEALRTPR